MSLFGSRRQRQDAEEVGHGWGLFLFDEVTAAMRAEKVLSAAEYECKLVAPPQHLRAGCDLAVALPAFERPGAEREMTDRGASWKSWADSLEGSMALADLVTTEDFGEFVMVRAGNMKITVEKETGRIVNTSGGGCPDIPYLNLELLGQTVWEAPRPRDLGFTLCGLMLDRAFVEAQDMLSRGGAAR